MVCHLPDRCLDISIADVEQRVLHRVEQRRHRELRPLARALAQVGGNCSRGGQRAAALDCVQHATDRQLSKQRLERRTREQLGIGRGASEQSEAAQAEGS